MSVISFFNSKGGAGKTTSCILLAQVLSKKGFKVHVIDADPNFPLVSWGQGRKKPSPFNIEPCHNDQTIAKQIINARESNDFVLVDLEGTKNVKAAHAVSKSDLVIIPMQRSNLDMQQAASCIEFIQIQSDVIGIKVPYCISITKTSPAIRSKALKQAYRNFENNGLQKLNVELFEREGFKNLFDYFETVYEIGEGARAESSISKCISNAEAYSDDVLAFLKAIYSTKEVA